MFPVSHPPHVRHPLENRGSLEIGSERSGGYYLQVTENEKNTVASSQTSSSSLSFSLIAFGVL